MTYFEELFSLIIICLGLREIKKRRRQGQKHLLKSESTLFIALITPCRSICIVKCWWIFLELCCKGLYPWKSIFHLRISHNTPCLPPKVCITFVKVNSPGYYTSKILVSIKTYDLHNKTGRVVSKQGQIQPLFHLVTVKWPIRQITYILFNRTWRPLVLSDSSKLYLVLKLKARRSLQIFIKFMLIYTLRIRIFHARRILEGNRPDTAHAPFRKGERTLAEYKFIHFGFKTNVCLLGWIPP